MLCWRRFWKSFLATVLLHVCTQVEDTHVIIFCVWVSFWWGWERKNLLIWHFYIKFLLCLPAVRIYLIFSYDSKPCNNVTTLPIIIFMWYLQICLGYLSCWDIIVGHTQKSAVSHSHMLSCTKKKKKWNILLTWVLVLKVEFCQMWNFLPNLCFISYFR